MRTYSRTAHPLTQEVFIIVSTRRSSVALLTIIIAGLVATPRTTLSYEISPRKKVHETLTLMASDCLRMAPRETGPSICLPSPETVMSNKALKNAPLDLASLDLGPVTAKELEEAVRWPDDPTREVGVWTILKFALKMKGRCEKSYTGGLKDGLLCSSHYGPLQFWHAMASSSEEQTVETQRKMLAWADFLYEVAAGGVEPETLYCEHWKERRRQGEGALANILAPEGGFPCTETESPWTIRTLFGFSCRSPFSSQRCDVSPEARVARLNALGALLHMVQDSYAQGHAGRGSAGVTVKNGRIMSKIECLPINQFYTYKEQDDRRHRQADAPPQPAPSCADASSIVHDPVLASANVLWLVQQKKGAAKLAGYLKNHVFPLADGHATQAGAGRCFSKTPHTDTPGCGLK